MRRKAKKQGSIYILTLAAALVLVGLVLGLTWQIMQFRRSSRSNTDIEQAYLQAELGIRHALYFVQNTPNWRHLLTSGRWIDEVQVGNATYSLDGIDEVDGNLSNNNDDPVTFVCTATVNGVSRTLSVQGHNGPLEICRFGVAARDDIRFRNHVVVNGDVSSNDNVIFDDATVTIDGNLLVGTTLYGWAMVTGIIEQWADSRYFPDSSDVLNYYLPKATVIPYREKIERVLLSPGNNPYGPENPDGLYVIYCSDRKVTITECRIIGTLVIMNPDSDSRIEKTVNWQPARSDYPALIVNGQMDIECDQNLRENNADYSLPGEVGFGTMNDEYPCLIDGMVYTTSFLEIEQRTQITGPVLTNWDIRLEDEVEITANPDWESEPVNGFRSGSFSLIPQTWSEGGP